MTVYVSKGTLTGTVNDVAAAQDFLTADPMTKYVAPQSDLEGVLEFVEWRLHGDGHHYEVLAVTNRELDDAELARLAEAVSGQNSDGLGEGFEQQPFAELREEGGGSWDSEDYAVGMVSFDWETNDSRFTRVA